MADTLENLVWECAARLDWSVEATGDLFYDFVAHGRTPGGAPWRLKIAADWVEFRSRAIALSEDQSLDLRCGPMEDDDYPPVRGRKGRSSFFSEPQSRLTVYYLRESDEDYEVQVGELVLHDSNLSRDGWHLLTFDIEPYDAHQIFDRDCEKYLQAHLARDEEAETELSLNHEDGLRIFLKAPIRSGADLRLVVNWGLKIAENVAKSTSD